ncbi:sigma-70 family RNA polymerase sigma factor [Demequina sp. NBRC 110057]|uniref:sigma-70 family RNA polymerase sigma factor n=1 Tax=Demequina sp. NBRC 110057 TaxID=1570346 RepID=UPI000A0696FF|nr:sigma-70 family RNA polymerase sigma factor [Demequina sp. NBRC 110057]
MPEWEPQLDELMARRYRDLVAFARMVTGNAAHAEDVVQDALVETFSRRRRFPTTPAAESYVRRVIASRAIDRGRRRSAERRALARVGYSESDTGAGPDLVVEHRADVARALGTLTERERACVVLRYLEHLSIEETAGVLGIAVGSVKRYVHDGIAKLSTQLGVDVVADARETARVEQRRA